MTPGRGNTLEIILNAGLAEQLRQHGLEAEAEQVVNGPDGRHQVDILVEVGESAVATGAEFAPGRTVLADAEKRLPDATLY